MHPHNAKDCDATTLADLRQLAAHERCVAIGQPVCLCPCLSVCVVLGSSLLRSVWPGAVPSPRLFPGCAAEAFFEMRVCVTSFGCVAACLIVAALLVVAAKVPCPVS